MRSAPIGGPGAVYAGWKVVFLTFMVTFFGAGTVFYGYSVYGLSFAAEFDASRTLVNAGFTAVLVMSGALSFLVAPLIARWGLSTVGIVGCVGTAAGLALVSLTTAMWQVILLFATLIALADTLIGSVLCNTLILRWFERRRGLALGLAATGASAAAIVFPPLTGVLTEALGWRMTFVINAGMLLLLVPFLVLWARVPAEGVMEIERLPKVDRPVVTSAANALSSRHILRNRDFWGITVAVGTLQGLNGAVMVSMVPFAMAAGIELGQATFLVSTIGACAFVSKLAFGFLADRIDLRLALRLALVCTALALVVLLKEDSYRALLVAAGLFGLSLGGMLPVWGAIFAAIHRPENYPKVIGWSRTWMTPHAVGLPLLAGVAYDMTGDYQAVWMLDLIFVAIAMAFTFLRTRQ